MPASKDLRYDPLGVDDDAYYSPSHPSDADDELGEDSMSDGTYNDLNDDFGSLSLGRAASPTPSTSGSVYSYHSSVDGNVLLKDVHGRVLNNTLDNYVLPDIGSGSGSWMLDMAKMFPHAEFVGMDLAPANLTEPPPSNCRFECDDANLGLSHYYGAFDVVHVSCVAQGITEFRNLMDEIAKVLRAGGVFLALDGDVFLWDENFKLIPPLDESEPGFSWTNRLIYAIRDALRARGPGIDDYIHIYDWLQEQGDIWESTGRKNLFSALGPWDKNKKQVGKLMQENFCNVVDAFKPMLLSYGFFFETVDRWCYTVKEEVQTMKYKHYIRWQCEWAVKSRISTQSVED
ncbi:hypothetical protein FRB90_002778 [Tulasnella sp. 427]|nr:hypothetical protein FRB90_002778 [Tulasnella sp. 427]